ncbi:MAG: hypothetical protein JKY37_19780, partial [Nannocystaceae bacterium]|nr:hypothetical protein [Nannocystaceae bacterium]
AGPLPISRSKRWIARVIDGSVVSAAVLGHGDSSPLGLSLDWMPDGRLAVGVRESNTNITRMLIVP